MGSFRQHKLPPEGSSAAKNFVREGTVNHVVSHWRLSNSWNLILSPTKNLSKFVSVGGMPSLALFWLCHCPRANKILVHEGKERDAWDVFLSNRTRKEKNRSYLSKREKFHFSYSLYRKYFQPKCLTGSNIMSLSSWGPNLAGLTLILANQSLV